MSDIDYEVTNLPYGTTIGGIPVYPGQQMAISKDIAATAMATITNCFTVTGGPILINQLGFLVTTPPSGGASLSFIHVPTSCALVSLCSPTSTAGAAAQQLFYVTGAKTNVLTKATDVGVAVASLPPVIMLSPGVVQAVFNSTAAPTTGAGTAFMVFQPLTGATVVA